MAAGRRFRGICGVIVHPAPSGRPQPAGSDRGRPAGASAGPRRAGGHQEVDHSPLPAPETEPGPAGGAGSPAYRRSPCWALSERRGGRVEL